MPTNKQLKKYKAQLKARLVVAIIMNDKKMVDLCINLTQLINKLIRK